MSTAPAPSPSPASSDAHAVGARTLQPTGDGAGNGAGNDAGNGAGTGAGRRADAGAFPLVGDRLWLDFVNTDDPRRPDGSRRPDVLHDFDRFVAWLEAADVLDGERAAGLRRRAQQQPAGAAAALVDARRVRATLRALAERGALSAVVRADAVAEINRVLGRSTVTRRVEERADGSYARAFVTIGDAFAGLTVPVVDSAADALVRGELPRVRRCSDPRCPRVFLDTTKNGRRRWCDMATCGNRAKAARHRSRVRPDPDAAH